MKDFFGFKLDEYGEWIDDLGPSIPDIESICLNCSLEKNIPDFIGSPKLSGE